jgi:hypothetical protein
MLSAKNSEMLNLPPDLPMVHSIKQALAQGGGNVNGKIPSITWATKICGHSRSTWIPTWRDMRSSRSGKSFSKYFLLTSGICRYYKGKKRRCSWETFM